MPNEARVNVPDLNGTTIGKQSYGILLYEIAVVALLGFIFVLNLCFALSLAFLDQATVSMEEESFSAVELLSMRKEFIDERTQNKKQMILLFEPHSVTSHDIKYLVDMTQEVKDQGMGENLDRLLLLKGVSGAFRPIIHVAEHKR
ncbi:hypothetical protein M8C21_017584, partial [Ambrosia artemisiifolia]